MAITEMKKGKNTYLVFEFWDGDKPRKIYCGKKGLKKTEANIKKAKRKHYESKLKRMQKMLD